MEEKEREENKMGWKEFFKPTKGKLIINVYLWISPFALFFILVLINGGFEGNCFGNSTLCTVIDWLMELGKVIYFPYFISKNILMLLITSLLYFYLLSCIITFIYNKSKNK